MRNILEDVISFSDAELAANKFAPHFIAVSSYLKILIARHFSSMSAQRQHLAALKKERARILEVAQARNSSSNGSAKTLPPVLASTPSHKPTPSAAASEPPSSTLVKNFLRASRKSLARMQRVLQRPPIKIPFRRRL